MGIVTVLTLVEVSLKSIPEPTVVVLVEKIIYEICANFSF